MRYAIISDIHGNLEAFEAVLSAISGLEIDKYFFLGDVVGYGADPSQCINLLKSLKADALISGNHEWGALGLKSLDDFTENAKSAIIWAKKVLSEEDKTYLKTFRLVHDADGITIVHGSLERPSDFNYVFTVEDASRHMSFMKNPLSFIGHTHRAGIFYSQEKGVRFTKGPEVRLEEKEKYIVNAGSVGQPRDLDPRASFATYDDEKKTVRIERVEYDVRKTQEKILKEGLPLALAYRLTQGR